MPVYGRAGGEVLQLPSGGLLEPVTRVNVGLGAGPGTGHRVRAGWYAGVGRDRVEVTSPRERPVLVGLEDEPDTRESLRAGIRASPRAREGKRGRAATAARYRRRDDYGDDNGNGYSNFALHDAPAAEFAIAAADTADANPDGSEIPADSHPDTTACPSVVTDAAVMLLVPPPVVSSPSVLNAVASD